MFDFINLTPHTITIYDDQDRIITSIEPSGSIARAQPHVEQVDALGPIPIYETVHVDSIGVPPEMDKTFYIVSRVVKLARPDRDDLLTPGTLVRTGGKVVGCLGLGR